MTSQTATQTAEALYAEAARHEQNAQESFERCDTDGFLSQWASGINAQVARANARIAENDGLGLFSRTVLQSLDGSPVSARQVQTRYGRRWRIDATDEWLPYQPVRESTLAKRGYREAEEEVVAPAKARSWAPAGARGLSGASQVRVRVFRTDVPAREASEWGYAGTPEA